MGNESAVLLRAIREAIDRVQAAPKPPGEERAVWRALAHLWSAYDEVTLLSRAPAPATKAQAA